MKITDFQQCVGCHLCEFVCNKQAIKLMCGSEYGGFCYPVIDESKCVACKKCFNTCTSNKTIFKQSPIGCEFIQNRNTIDLKSTTSGGAATALSKAFVTKYNGVVYGAAFDSNMKVKHLRCESLCECDRLKGSKYIQSDMTGIHNLIENDLKENRYVLFIGTPCQCASLEIFSNYPNLFICDFTCNGVGSPTVFEKHKNYIEHKYNSTIKKYVFRPKNEFYLEPYELVEFNNNKIIRLISPWEKWGTLYYNAMVTRDSCYDCKFTTSERVGDLTFADVPIALIDIVDCAEDVRRYGATYVCVNSQKGNILRELLHETCSHCISELIPTERMTKSVLKSPKRDKFLEKCQASTLS